MRRFSVARAAADEIVLTDIYAASEEPIDGITIERLADEIARTSGRPVHVARSLDDVLATVLRVAKPGDAVITLGAGSIGTLPARLVDALTARRTV
jgi:UDP-N-acetylmuramate--alanine ligase